MLVKLKFRFPEIVLGMLLAVAIFAIGIIFSSNPPNNNPNNQANPNPNQPPAPMTNWHIFGAVLVPADILSGLLVMATIGLGFVTWRGIRNQSKETKILQRAYISVEPGGIKPFEGRGGDDRVACNIIINNAGNLPASKLSWVIERTFSQDAYRRNFQITAVKAGNIILAPRVAAIKGANSVQTSEFDDAVEGAQPDRAWLYIWGRVSYHDGFRGGRWTEFCHRYNLRGASEYAVPKENGRYHEYGNRTDES